LAASLQPAAQMYLAKRAEIYKGILKCNSYNYYRSVDVINDLDETNPVGESCSSRSIRTSAKPKEHCRPEEPSTSACPSLPWPHEFKIREQSMPQSVRCALQNKERLTKPITVSLMDFLYETITQYTL